MTELWQLYDEQGRPIAGKGVTKQEGYAGLLHGASHVWIWQKRNDIVEVLLQQRAANKITWPNRFDVSAAGHIDLGEDPLTTAVRETSEELGLHIAPEDLRFIGVDRRQLVATSGTIENELCWLYTFSLPPKTSITLEKDEVKSVVWKSIADIQHELTARPSDYVPHGQTYYDVVLEHIQKAAR